MTQREAASADLDTMRAGGAPRIAGAFATLHDRYAPRIGSYLMKLLKQPELVDEAVNDTYVGGLAKCPAASILLRVVC